MVLGCWHLWHSHLAQPVKAVCTALLTKATACSGNGGSPGVPAPGTPSPSFIGAETLGAGLESLRAPSHQSASGSAEDPEAGRQPLDPNWANSPTHHHQRLISASMNSKSLMQDMIISVHRLRNSYHSNVTSSSPLVCR